MRSTRSRSSPAAYVVRAVATQMQIAWCLAHYYGHVTTLGERLLQPNAQAGGGRAKRRQRCGRRGRAADRRDQCAAQARARAGAGPLPATPTMRVPEAAAEAAADRGPAARTQRVRRDSRAGAARAVIQPPYPEEDSVPVDPMEADEPKPARARTPTGRAEAGAKPMPVRKRPAESDPPELAARAGELGVRTGAGAPARRCRTSRAS